MSGLIFIPSISCTPPRPARQNKFSFLLTSTSPPFLHHRTSWELFDEADSWLFYPNSCQLSSLDTWAVLLIFYIWHKCYEVVHSSQNDNRQIVSQISRPQKRLCFDLIYLVCSSETQLECPDDLSFKEIARGFALTNVETPAWTVVSAMAAISASDEIMFIL